MSVILTRRCPLLLLLLLVGCQPSAPVDRPGRSGHRVALVPKGMTHEFWQSIHRGGEQAARDYRDAGTSVTVIFQGPLRERDALEQIRIVDRQVSAGIDGLVLAPQHSRTMIPPVQRAVDQGVKVVIIDSGLAREDLAVKYIATDNYRGGQLAGRRLLDVLRREGRLAPKIVLFRYAVGSESTEQREKGFEAVIDQTIADPNSDIKPVWLSRDKFAGATKDSAQREAAPLVNQYHDQIDGIFAVNESSAAGMLDVLRNAGLSGPGRRIRLIGFDSSEPLLKAMREGDLDGLILQNPYRMGYLSVWTAVQALEGKRTVADPPWDRHAVSTGEVVVTRENVDSPEVRELYDANRQPEQRLDLPTFPPRE